MARGQGLGPWMRSCYEDWPRYRAVELLPHVLLQVSVLIDLVDLVDVVTSSINTVQYTL